MAKQRGFLKIEGSLGDTSFLKTKAGYLAKTKSVIPASKILTDPKFARTRENMSEFSRAAKAGMLLRNSISSLVNNAKDTNHVGRLLHTIMKVVKSDTTHARGQRVTSSGNIQLLKGFNFNLSAVLRTNISMPFTANIDRVTGSLTINIPGFVPADKVKSPVGATHFKLVSGGAELDFDNDVYTSDHSESATLPIDNSLTAVINLANTVPAGSTHTLILVLGLQYLEQVNGVMYPLKNGSFNSLSLVKLA